MKVILDNLHLDRHIFWDMLGEDADSEELKDISSPQLLDFCIQYILNTDVRVEHFLAVSEHVGSFGDTLKAIIEKYEENGEYDYSRDLQKAIKFGNNWRDFEQFYTDTHIDSDAVQRADIKDFYTRNRSFLVEKITDVEHFIDGISLTRYMKTTILQADKYKQVDIMLDSLLRWRTVENFCQFLVAFRPYIESLWSKGI